MIWMILEGCAFSLLKGATGVVILEGNAFQSMSTTQWRKTLEIPGRVLFSEGNGELPRLEINTAWSTAEIYLHGAHVTNFQKGRDSRLSCS